jgi:Ran GTPase-activating protein (RanGAP) involved in mRNA processing and transport
MSCTALLQTAARLQDAYEQGDSASAARAAAELQAKLFLTKACRRNVVVEILKRVPIHLTRMVFSSDFSSHGNIAQLLGALPSSLQPLAVECCCRGPVLALAIPHMASFNKRPGTALGECFVHLPGLLALDLQGYPTVHEPYDPKTPPVPGCRLGITGIAAHLTALAALERLSITNVHIDSLAGRALAAGLALVTTLRQLQLISCSVPEGQPSQIMAALISYAFPYLTRLTDCHLASSYLHRPGSEALGHSLMQLTDLVVLDVADHAIDAGGAAGLAWGITALQKLQLLSLRNNRIGNGNLSTLAASLGSLTALLGLNLNDCSLGLLDLHSLAQSLTRMRRLRWLRCSGAAAGAAGADVLRVALATVTTLEHLELQGCQLGAAGAAPLALLIPALPRLAWFDISGNAIGDGGCMALAPALAQCSSMTELMLADNHVGDSGAAALSLWAGCMPSLLELVLHGNHISEAARASLARMVSSSCTVRCGCGAAGFDSAPDGAALHVG